VILRTIELTNIRSYLHESIGFDKGITVITGRTGSGKSTILMSLEYALFGNAASVSGNALLRRGAHEGSIRLVFEHAGHEYVVERGLVRIKEKVSFNKDSLALYKDGERVPVISRVRDLDEMICDILGYDADANASELFSVTSYTRQDEIKKLMTLSSEKRQEFIDSILQLAKYKLAWVNIKDLVSHFSQELSRIDGMLSAKTRLEAEQSELIAKKEKKEKEYAHAKARLSALQKKQSEHEKKHARTQEQYSALKKQQEHVYQKKARIHSLETQQDAIAKRIDEIEKKLPDLEIMVAKSGAHEFDLLLENKSKTHALLETKQEHAKKAEEEEKRIRALGIGACPVCKQEVKHEHVLQVSHEYAITLEQLHKEIDALSQNHEHLAKRVENAREGVRAKQEQDALEAQKHELATERTHRLDELATLHAEDDKGVSEKNMHELEAEREACIARANQLSTERAQLETQSAYLLEAISEHEEQIKQKKAEQAQISKQEAQRKQVSNVCVFLSNLREDVRNIREVVRDTFLDAFKVEFHKYFEELRRFEEEYTVDVKTDYEPVAYATDGLEVSINALSGGEKTSVALSYRLALAYIAAELGGVSQSELLILDEPTVGFDSEDVRLLPEILQSIRIPQIIIVTHEEELKTAADVNYITNKKAGVTRISAQEFQHLPGR